VGEELSAKSKATRDPEERPLRSLLLALAGVLGGGLGGLTFVAFVGGAINFARIRGAGLPTALALSKEPQSDLLAVGADQLLAPFVVSATLVLIVWPVWFMKLGRRLLNKQVRLGVLSALALAAVLYLWFTAHPRPIDSSNPDSLLILWFAVVVGIASVYGAWRLGEYAISRSKEGMPASKDGLPARVAFGLVVFMTSMTMLAAATYALYLYQPKVQPVAILLKSAEPGLGGPGARNDHALSGIYVGENANAIYVGVAHEDPKHPGQGKKTTAYVLTVPRSDVTAMRVGDYETLRTVLWRGPCELAQMQNAKATCAPEPK
jgi:hypothetical protein